MRKFKHLSINEKIILKDLSMSELYKKKNGKINYSKIARFMGRDKETIRRELKKFKEYDPLKSQKQYLKNRKNSKKHITLTVKQIKWLNKNFNILHNTPETICKLYEQEFNEKFPMCFKTLYKYIYLGLFNMDKKYLYFKGKKRKTKNSTDNRGKLSNYRTIEEAKHDRYEFGWFQMDCIVGADHRSSVLTFTEELTKFTIAEKLKEQSAKEVVKTIKNIFKNRLFKNCIKGIITDQGKEFSNWKEIEKITGANVYFCDAGTPTQKPHVERMNRDIRHWLPPGTDFNKVDNKQLNWIMKTINNKLRPCLNWISSKKAFEFLTLVHK
ncbi:IS30 family transposase [Spiroplasma poulsonii]|uniref:IS30 family transposase n=4 Tax=Spiroplasma poulsonii TaxID=2138 RepID=A0A3S0U8H0_9MOLU|nr:IS30 family transposase [Spiroplasma poulsonii]MBW3059495.1 IS30 family transposase [Spiroplasma poulsonii]MBW3059547.1 IS30 family transposase [Spiroplasma poulsonii]RUP75108.1 IS30 family transposase [Spiroplasma poulsonii]RUP76035.1 IS30 family transposase [Spiroplasma poulsonii]